MKKSNQANVPTLKEIVVPGHNFLAEDDDDVPLTLNTTQLQNLDAQIEKIVRTRLQAVLDKAVQNAVADIKAHLDKLLPKIAATAAQDETEG